MKKKWRNADYRDNCVKNIRKSIEKIWQNKEFRDKRILIAKNRLENLWRDKDYRKKMILMLKNRWKDENFREKMSSRIGIGTGIDHPFRHSGKEHPAYKNGSGKGYNHKIILLSIKLLGKDCQDCDSNNNVVTHHIDGNPRNNPLDGSNWMRLCSSCHFWLHFKGYKYNSYQEYRLYRNRLRHRRRNLKIRKIIYAKFKTKEFLFPRELQRILKVTRERIRQMREEDKLNYTKIGGRYFYPKNKYLK